MEKSNGEDHLINPQIFPFLDVDKSDAFEQLLTSLCLQHLLAIR